MYKDVWKKFGVKIFIVVCSVLLLGGAAIAVPRLQAANGRGQTPFQQARIDKLPAVPTGGALTLTPQTVDYELDIDNFEANKAAKQELGVAKWPDINYSYNGISGTMAASEYAPLYSNNSELKKCGEHKDIVMVANDTNTVFNEGVEFTCTYTTNRRLVSTNAQGSFRVTNVESHVKTSDGVNQGLQSDIYFLNGTDTQMSGSLRPDDVEVEITVNDKKYVLPSYEIESVSQSNDTKKNLGDMDSFSVKLKNYTSGNNDVFNGDKSFSIQKHIKNLTILYGTTEITEDTGIEILPNENIENLNISMQDGSKDFKAFKQSSDDNNNLVISVSGSTEYTGTRIIPVRYNTGTSRLEVTGIISPVTYGDRNTTNGYEQIPGSLRYYSSDQDTAGTVLGSDDYKIAYKFKEGNTTLTGATAGRVQMEVTGKGAYEKLIKNFPITQSYGVRRSLGSAKMEASIGNQTVYYDGEVHDPIVQVYFDDANSKKADGSQYYLRNPQDYEITYTNNNQNVPHVVDAGRTTVTASGTAADNAGGYYGRQSTTVTIEPRPIKEIKLDIGDDARYSYTGNNVLDTIKLTATDSIDNLDSWDVELNKDYTVRIYKDGQLIPGSEAIDIGNYRVEYTFIGNYKNAANAKLETEFEIYTYPIEGWTCEPEKVCKDSEGENTHVVEEGGTEHIYDGTEHKPRIIVKYGNNEIPAGAYDTVYTNNINAGTVDVTVTGKGTDNGGKKKELSFKIEPFDLNKLETESVQLELPKSFGPDKDGNYAYPYSGKTVDAIELPSVTFTYKDQPFTMNQKSGDEDKLYAYDTDTAELWTTGTNPHRVSGLDDYPQADAKYRYVITGANNYTGTASTGEFTLTGKSINDPDITVSEIPDMSFDDFKKIEGLDSDKFKEALINHIESQLTITDRKLGTLTADEDYEVEIDDNTNEDGTVEVTIKGKGGYIDTYKEKVTLHVGENIADPNTRVKIFYNQTTAKVRDDDPQGYLMIAPDRTFKVDENNKNSGFEGMQFVTNDSDNINGDAARTQVCLGIGNLNTENRLYNGTHYEINSTQYDFSTDELTGRRIAYREIIGKNGFYGTLRVYFLVDQEEFNDRTYQIEFNKTYVYNGSGQWPVVADLTLRSTDGLKVISGQALDMNFEIKQPAEDMKPKDAGEYDFTITGKYGYYGSITTKFKIEKCDLETAYNENKIDIPKSELADSYKYAPTTLVDGIPREGVWPIVEKIRFLPQAIDLQGAEVILERGKDFTIQAENNRKAWEKNVDDGNAPYITITAISTSNFTGFITREFQISRIDLSRDCDLTISNVENQYFTGKPLEPKVELRLKESGELVPQTDKDGNPEYNIVYEGETRFVTESNRALVKIEAVKNGDGKYTGNYKESISRSFTVIGDLDMAAGTMAGKNSRLLALPAPLVIEYGGQEDPKKFISQLTYWQAEDEKGSEAVVSSPAALQAAGYKSLELTRDDYDASCLAQRIGPNFVQITGKNRFGRSQNIAVYIRGDLSTATMTAVEDVKKDPVVIEYVSDQDILLEEEIGTVFCGGMPLEYGKDFAFDRTPNMSVGTEHTIRLVPTEDAISRYYLKEGSFLEFKYIIKQGLEGVQITGVRDSYDYAHGEPVITEEQVGVLFDDKRLDPDNYDVTIEGAVDVSDKGGYVIITGKGGFMGRAEKHFVITPYDLGVGYDKKEIQVTYTDTLTYTGDELMPEDAVVTVPKIGKTLELNKDYTVAGGEGDIENATKKGSEPTFLIKSASDNYKNAIELPYTIKRRSITKTPEGELSEGISIEPISDQTYKNGKDITPIPRITYQHEDKNPKDLKGGLYELNGDYTNTELDFTYEYESTDRQNASEKPKIIRIRGVGNFSGEKTIEYKVVPKNLSDEDVVVTLTNGSPEYNGKDQCPAFQLTYDGDVILTYTGKDFTSTCMKNPQLAFVDALNVGDNGQVTITPAEEDTNYTGSKIIKFSIVPASIENRIRFLYHPAGTDGTVNLSSYKLNMPFSKGHTVKPEFGQEAELAESQIGVFYNNTKNANHGALLTAEDYTVEYRYVQPGTDDEDVRPEYQSPDPELSYAGKVKVTITGQGNYKDSASFYYYIGRDISSEATIRLQNSSVVYNAQVQAPVEIVSGVKAGEYTIVKYKDKIDNEFIITDNDFVNVGEYYVCVDGDPMNGTYSSAPQTMTYTITSRPLSKNIVIDGFKKEYAYTGRAICPVGIAVTDYIDNIKYKLTEGLDYTLSYANNTNAGVAVINVTAKGNYQGSASAQFAIISSAISSGDNVPDGSFMDGNGEISGATPISPDDVKLTMDTNDAMYYTGKALYPSVSIKNMTENVDYTVTYSNNTEIGTGVITIQGIGNNTGMIKKYFRIIASLSDCTIVPIPDQEYTGKEVKPMVTIMCGNTILSEGIDYTLSYINNIEIGTGTVMARAAANGYFTGSASANFNIGNNVRSFVITGYASSCIYSGEAVTPDVIVESGNVTLTRGVDYTVSYANNTNAGLASITVTGIGKFEGTQTVNFVIEPKSISTCTTTEAENKVYTGDAYTPPVTVSDNGKELTNGIDYTITYTNNTNPGTASIIIEAANTNYSGTKVINFQIEGVPVESVKASSVKYSSMNLSWKKQDYADGYQICDAQSRVIESVTANNTKLTGLAAGTTYRYKIRSYILNADGSRSYSTFSQVVSATTKLEAPTTKLTSKKKGQVRISWSRVTGADGYELFYKRSKSGTYQKVKTINNKNTRICNVKGLKSKKKCYLRIKAFKNSGSAKIYSTMSKAKTIKVK